MVQPLTRPTAFLQADVVAFGRLAMSRYQCLMTSREPKELLNESQSTNECKRFNSGVDFFTAWTSVDLSIDLETNPGR